ncbi:MAG: PilZ domain-containing protein [Planctomycetales bacterium]|nr:PilZ domain-containing protein [Planctomycetales bacterium]
MTVSFLQSGTSKDVKDFVLNVLLLEARDAENERRAHGRIPFFQPARITLDGDDEPRTAFTRDIEASGIGLLHQFQVDAGRVTVELNVPDGGTIRLLVDIPWCIPCGEGWYISGGTIAEAVVVA